MLEKRTKQLLAIAPRLIRCIFDIELTYVYLILSSYCQYFHLFLPSNCHDLWPIMQAVLLTVKYFQCADKNKLRQQGSVTQILNGGLKSDSWFHLAGGCQELLGPQTAFGDHRRWRGRYTHAGSWGERAGCRRDLMWARASPAPAAGPGCLRWLVSTTPASASSPRRRRSPRLRARAPAPAADVRLRRAQAGTSTCRSCPGCKRRAALLYKWILCSSTVSTDCTITVMQREIKCLCPGRIRARFSGQSRHLGSIASLLPVFLHYYLLDHHYYIHYYPVISTLLPCYYCNMSPLLLIITFVIAWLLFIITSLLHHYYILLSSHYYLLLQ